MLSELESQRRGKLGLSRTESVVGERYWVLHSSVDVDGADLLVREPCDPTITSSAPLHVVRIQAKYRSLHSPALVPIFYAERNGKPRPDFFLFLHTGESPSEPVMWFFDAEELLNVGERTTDGKHIRLKLSSENSYPDQKRDRAYILDQLSRGLKASTQLQAMQWLTLWRNPTAAEFVQRYRRQPTDFIESLGILERLFYSDLELLDRLSRYVVFIDSGAYLLPLAEFAGRGDGIDDYLKFPFAIERHNLPDAKRFLTALSKGQLQLPERDVTNLIVWDSNGIEHLFPLTEGFGLKVRCRNHPGCYASIVNATLGTFWKNDTRTWHRGERLSQLDPQWNLGFLSPNFRPSELRRLESLGVIASLASVRLDKNQLLNRLIRVGTFEGRLTSESALYGISWRGLDDLVALELTPGGKELLEQFSPCDFCGQTLSIVKELIEYWHSGKLHY